MPRKPIATALAASISLAALSLTAGPARAQLASDDCGTLISKYDGFVKTAEGMLTNLVGEALKGGDPSGALGKLGLAGQGLSPEQAMRKGAVAALAPPAQAAAGIYLLRANTAMQELVWKGCKPPG